MSKEIKRRSEIKEESTRNGLLVRGKQSKKENKGHNSTENGKTALKFKRRIMTFEEGKFYKDTLKGSSKAVGTRTDTTLNEDERVRRVSDVVAFANLSLDQWIKAQGKGNLPLLSPLKEGDGAEQWIKPSSGIKLNVDAAIFASSFKHGFGCVVRNSDGDLVSVFAGIKDGSVAPELAESIGIREALSWLKDNAYTRAIIETDSLVCVEAIRSEETLVSAFGLVVDDCKNILKNLFNVSISFVKRSANCAAHYVARHSVTLAERMFPINSVPLNFMSILESDCSF
uniref:RNase H type-1 domain-containing protein n=1 Tax=Cannabis sativa TaxID=3483 RepID=A0A803NT92_CANSA